MWNSITGILKQLWSYPKGFEGEPALLRWLQSQKGSALLVSERERTARVLAPVVSGYHFLVLGPSIEPSIVEGVEYSHFFQLCTSANSVSQARVNYDELPLPADLIDTVVMHHVLEYSQNPHRVLNEATRVLKPGGHLVIIFFNPYSCYGVFSLILRLFSKDPLWHRHPLRKGRLLDWLKLLHMQPISCASAGYLLPKRWVNRWKNHPAIQFLQGKDQLPLGAYQVVLAKKVITRPIKSKGLTWQMLPKAKASVPQSRASHEKNKVSN